MSHPYWKLLLVTLVGCASAPEQVEPPHPSEVGHKFITIGTDALPTVKRVLEEEAPGEPLIILEQTDKVAMLSVDAAHFATLSERMHEEHNRCGGFARHDTPEEAEAALRAPDHERIVSLAVDYVIDNAVTVNAVLPELQKPKILKSIQDLSAFQNRYYNSTFGAASSNFIKDSWTTIAAGRPDITIENVDHGFAQKSVVLTIPGTSLESEVVVIGGHQDSIAPGGATSTAPGADDDASGIATITEVLRALVAKNYRPARTVKFMAYAAEEVGLVGSSEIADAYEAQDINVVGVVQFDMTNYKGSTKDIWLIQDYTNAAQNEFVQRLIDTYVGATWGVATCGYACSDHASWHNTGVPASMPFEANMSQYNPNIHTPNDTLEVSNNNVDHAIKFARLGVSYVAELAKGRLGTDENTAPTVTITAPANGSTHPAQVTLSGTASDAEDGPMSNLIQWTSSKDGALGTGATVQATLTAGAHVLTAKATDSGSLSTTKTVSITVSAATGEAFNEDFEGGHSWTTTGYWHLATSSSCAPPGYASPTHAMYYGRDAQCNYYAPGSPGSRNSGTLTSPNITGLTGVSTLAFKFYRDVEKARGSYDVVSVDVVVGATATNVYRKTSATSSSASWLRTKPISLAQFAGQTIKLRFTFDTIDGRFNIDYKGWLVDDIVVTN
ncbi:MAG: M20/M25/M40 family metallo-hydrolase [Kofleriaceae bacterium]